MRGRPLAFASIGVVLVACTAAPEIPNDLQHNTFPTSGSAHESSSGSSSSAESNDDLPGSTPTSGTHGADSGAGTDTDAGTVVTDSGATTAPGPCAGQTSANACFQCCEQNNPGTVDELNAYWDQCVCDPGRCGTQCADSWCAGFYPFQGDACDQCLNAQEAACDTQADNSCAGDASCSKLLTCDSTSGCANKP